MTPPRVLTIAGSDSGGGAGVQADLATFAAFGVHGMSVLTSVTAQNSLGVHGRWDVPLDAVRAQLASVLGDLGADAVKTGMLGGADVVAVVAEEVRGAPMPLVVDPVVRSSTGRVLLDPDGVAALRDVLLPLATVVTPNLAEATLLGGVPVRAAHELRAAADAILALGPRWVLVTGGHLAGDALDLLTDGTTYLPLRGRRVDSRHLHGSGCTFASAIAAGLAAGEAVPEAVRAAKVYVTGAIAAGYPLGGGAGPVDRAWRSRGVSGRAGGSCPP